jgi:hypothetical protein
MAVGRADRNVVEVFDIVYNLTPNCAIPPELIPRSSADPQLVIHAETIGANPRSTGATRSPTHGRHGCLEYAAPRPGSRVASHRPAS